MNRYSSEVWERKCRPIFKWIKGEFEKNLRMPTNREMVAAGFVSSTSQSKARLVEMEKLGWLTACATDSATTHYRIVGAKVVFEEEVYG